MPVVPGNFGPRPSPQPQVAPEFRLIAQATYEREADVLEAQREEYHFGNTSAHAYIDSMAKGRAGTFEPFRQHLEENPEHRAFAVDATKRIADAYAGGNLAVKREVDRFREVTGEGQKDFVKEHGHDIKPGKIPDGTLWEIYVNAFNRSAKEEAYNSDSPEDQKKYMKEWAQFDARGRHRFPVQELLSEIDKGNPPDLPLKAP